MNYRTLGAFALALVINASTVSSKTASISSDQNVKNTQSTDIAKPVNVTKDTPETLPSGATFTLPKDWSKQKTSSGIQANAPEGDLHLATIDVGVATSADDATAKAWALYAPTAQRKPKLTTTRPPRNGWDEVAVIDYEISPNEKATVFAIAKRKDKNWTVQIIDGSEATAEKRGAALGLLVQSLRPQGYERENFANRKAHPLDAARIAALSDFVTASMKQLNIPGASFALVENGKVVFEGGFGVREIGKPNKVDANTLFMVASNTKGMATLLLAEMVDAGKVSWDEKVTNVYPSFRLGNDETTSQVLIKHLVCACTGLPRKDYEWLFNTTPDTTATETFTQLANTMPTSGFGEVFQYNNLMASAAGYIAGHLVYPDMELGAAYDLAMQEKVFGPLGMKDTTFDFARALAGNYASPYAYTIDSTIGAVQMKPNYAVYPYRPAGGAWSSAHDMILYVQNELSKGMLPNGTRLISEQNLLERRKPNVPSGEDGTYGMGLEVDTTWGVPVVKHGGSMFGYKSDIMFVPDANVGAVILTNSDEGGSLLRPFMRRLLEILYDGKPEAAENVASAAKAIRAATLEERSKLEIPSTALGLATSYSNPELGYLRVRKEGNKTFIDVASWSSEVASRKNDDKTVSLLTIMPGLTGLPLVIGTKDGKKTLTARDSQHEYVYIED
ncbi:MAG: beta-lactamase family protein [Arenimonas sp.]|nr:beta-lactamase family protein [Arenimonas sp.]